MKKLFLSITLLCLLSIIFVGVPACGSLVKAQCGGIVGCPTGDNGTYSIDDFFGMLGRIYNFIVLMIAAPLAVIAVSVGGIMMLISAGNPNLMGIGKKVFWSAIIGLALALGSYAIINFVLGAVSGGKLKL